MSEENGKRWDDCGRSVYELVNQSLVESKDARNDDNVLIFEVWRRQTGKRSFSKADASGLFSPSTIVRFRRKIQNSEGRLLPTEPDVIFRRGFDETDLRVFYGTGSDVFGSFLGVERVGE